jgi:hypothetical protein
MMSPIELTVELPAASSSRELHILEALGRETGSGLGEAS